MFVRNTWRPEGLLDIKIIDRPVVDPEGELYKNERAWFLLRSSDDLARFEWPEDAVVCVCLEAVRERTDMGPWRKGLGRLFFVSRDDVANVETTELFRVKDPAQRFVLRDLAAAHRRREGMIYR